MVRRDFISLLSTAAGFFFGGFLGFFASFFVFFEAFLPFVPGFAGQGHGVFKADDFLEGNAAPDHKFSVANGLIDEDGVGGFAVEHADDPFFLVLGGEGGDAVGGGGGEGEGGSEGAVFGGEVFKGGDFLESDERGALEKAFLVSHLKGENHLGIIDLGPFEVKGEGVFFGLFPHRKGLREKENEREAGEDDEGFHEFVDRGAGQNGLDFFSSPIVVSGPWPGKTVVSSGRG